MFNSKHNPKSASKPKSVQTCRAPKPNDKNAVNKSTKVAVN